jgi:hypothetical protein
MCRTTLRSLTWGKRGGRERSKSSGNTGPWLGTSLGGKVTPRCPRCDFSNIDGSGISFPFLGATL